MEFVFDLQPEIPSMKIASKSLPKDIMFLKMCEHYRFVMKNILFFLFSSILSTTFNSTRLFSNLVNIWEMITEKPLEIPEININHYSKQSVKFFRRCCMCGWWLCRLKTVSPRKQEKKKRRLVRDIHIIIRLIFVLKNEIHVFVFRFST